jgi:hypothetical protein
MSSLLLRLGARAIGQGRSVRPASRLPYAAAPIPRGEPWQTDTPDVPKAAWDAQPEAIGLGSTPWAPPDGTDAGQSPREAGILPMPVPPGALRNPPEALAPPSFDTPLPDAAMAGPPPEREPHRPARGDPSATESANQDRTERADAPGSVREVPPLLPLRTPDWATPAAPPFAPAAEHTGRGQGEETTEVHVHIGRIEVTAVHEAPASKRPASERAKPTTLEDYLARRQGGAR